jgi:hypothetical protein
MASTAGEPVAPGGSTAPEPVEVEVIRPSPSDSEPAASAASSAPSPPPRSDPLHTERPQQGSTHTMVERTIIWVAGTALLVVGLFVFPLPQINNWLHGTGTPQIVMNQPSMTLNPPSQQAVPPPVATIPSPTAPAAYTPPPLESNAHTGNFRVEHPVQGVPMSQQYRCDANGHPANPGTGWCAK